MNLCDIVHTLKVVPESGIVKLDRKMDIMDIRNENRRLKRWEAAWILDNPRLRCALF